jgi:hypothetical protein
VAPELEKLQLQTVVSVCGAMAATHSLELELVRLRKALEEERSEIDRLRDAVGAAGLAESMRRESREKLDADMARLRLEWTKAADEQEEAFRKVCPFVFEHAISLRDECRKAPDNRHTHPGHCPIGRSCVLGSVAVERWELHSPALLLLAVLRCRGKPKYLVKIAGFPSWRTIRSWRADLLAQSGLDEDIFDGSEEPLHKLMVLIRKVREGTGHLEGRKGSVACDAPSATAGVSVALMAQCRG